MKSLILGIAIGAAAAGLAAPARAEQPRGTYKVVPPRHPSAGTIADIVPKHRILYMNGKGGTFTPGFFDDSSQNISTIPYQVSTVPAWNKGADKWAQLMDCVRKMYEPFDIEITDVEPAPTVEYIESVVGGSPGDVGMGAGVGGVSPFTNDCSIIERSIVYTFAAVYGNNIQAICETVAQESAHSFGLDHEFLCQDPMTYLGGCGPKNFQDVDARCGEYSARDCACGNSTQNSVQSFLRFLGTSDPIPPTVSFVSPLDGEMVPRGATVVANPQDDKRVAWVELWVDGAKEATRNAEPWEFTLPVVMSYGAHMLELRVVDQGRNMTSATESIDLEPECTSDADCAAGLSCGDGRCAAGLSTPCLVHADCASDVCARDDQGELACTQSCASADCPSGYACDDASKLCWPDAGGGGGCRVGGPAGAGGGILLVLVCLAAMLRRRSWR